MKNQGGFSLSNNLWITVETDLDFIYDKAADRPYFRMSIIEDDDPWFGSESYHYLDAEDIHGLLSKNGIDLFEGMTELNWKSYIWFTKK